MRTATRYILVVYRSFGWLIFTRHRRKLKKVWSVYKAGGLRLCWHYMVERFGAIALSYKPFQNELSAEKSKSVLANCTNKPRFSIIVPVYNVAAKWLEKCIDSVIDQHYENWELILVNDASDDEHIRPLIEAKSAQDDRIQSYHLQKNLGIAGATNFAMEKATGQFIGFLDHDDELTADALTWMTWTINRNPQALWIYSDEDLISASGRCYSPHLKPDFSPELLLSNMYTCHFSVYSRDILTQIGGLREGFEGSQDHDLALRLSEVIAIERIAHIPRVLYHWRVIPGSTAMGVGAKPEAPSAGRKAVTQALQRRNIKGKVVSYELCPTLYQIEFEPLDFPKVSIIIPTRNALSLTRTCIDSVRSNTDYPNFEIVVIDNNSDEPELLEYLKEQQSENELKVIRYEKPFNHSEMNNIAVDSVDSEFVVLMNNDIEILTDKWLEQLIAVAQTDETIAVVGPLLLYPDGTVQHAGIILGIRGTAGHAHKFINGKASGHRGRLHALQDFSGITAAFALTRRSSFKQVGGFDCDNYPTLYNDVDLCIRLRQNGFRCVYNPMVKAIHHETKTRPIGPEEFACKLKLKSDYLDILANDPFYNPNFALDNEQFHGFRKFPVEDQFAEAIKPKREKS